MLRTKVCAGQFVSVHEVALLDPSIERGNVWEDCDITAEHVRIGATVDSEDHAIFGVERECTLAPEAPHRV